MKRLLPLLCFSILTASALAADKIRDVQTELKSQGFYYGEITGNDSNELTAAIRRYQIRNGLEVTGELNAETSKSLNIGGAASSAPPITKKTPSTPSNPPRQATVTPTPPTKPPVHLRRNERNETAREDDRRYLEEEAPPRGRSYESDRSVVRPPAPLDENPVASSEEYADLFAGTPYARAPRVVQEQTVRRAQTLLASRGYYRDAVDGDAGPATEEAILAFQRGSRLPLTGRLDLQTLAQLRLLPGRGPGNPPLRPFNAAPDRSSRQVYRGVWVE